MDAVHGGAQATPGLFPDERSDVQSIVVVELASTTTMDWTSLRS
jgi:hypothetical protein